MQKELIRGGYVIHLTNDEWLFLCEHYPSEFNKDLRFDIHEGGATMHVREGWFLNNTAAAERLIALLSQRYSLVLVISAGYTVSA